jgi:SAM-dependent methyltransferase
MRREISKEIGIHGPQWHTLHGGYFSDATIAGRFIEEVRKAIAASHPEVLVDLGGGTGYLLAELIKHNVDSDIRLVNLDCSDAQLAMARHRRISSICGSIADFMRIDVDQESKRFLLIMRSVLHYFGRDGLMPLLNHLRSQMKEGEIFVHQTASFESGREACCINMLYKLMGTSKWYPTIKELCRCIEKAGWTITAISSACTLTLASDDLAKRYSLDEHDIAHIRVEIIKRFGRTSPVFKLMHGGFCAYLHYRIYTCVAVPAKDPDNANE